MDNNNERFFQQKLQESIDNQRIAYDEMSWQRLSQQLDLAEGQQAKRRGISAAWLLLLLPLLAWNTALQHQISVLQTQLVANRSVSSIPQEVQKTIYVHDTINRIFYKNIYIKDNQNLSPQLVAKANDFFSKKGDANSSFSDSYDAKSALNGAKNKQTLTDNNNNNKDKESIKENELIENNDIHNDTIAQPQNSVTTTIKIAEEAEKLATTPQQIIKKRKHIKLTINDIWVNGAHTLAGNNFREMAVSGGLSLRLNKSINLQAGVQSNFSNHLMNHEDIAAIHTAPMPHLSDDKAISVNYQTQHLSFPLQIQYFTKKKYRLAQPFFNIGALIQQHKSTTLTYNFETHTGETYSIKKEISEKHWKPFANIGAGIDILPTSHWAISFAINARQALQTKHLLAKEQRLLFVNLGLKYKF